VVFALTEIRAYRCDSCGASFYASRQAKIPQLTEEDRAFIESSCFKQEREG
jgi:hypothetical protein